MFVIVINENNRSVLLGCNLNYITYSFLRFSNNGIQLNLDTSILNAQKNVLLICSIRNDNDFIEMLFVIEKLRDFEIDVLLMYFPFGRTENGVNFIANLLKNMGVKHITSVDMHTSHERIHNINLAKFWRNFISDEYVIVAPDKGAVLRSGSLYHLSLLKKRLNNTVIITWNDEIFDIKEKNCMIVDDMIDTGKTVVVTSNFLIENGAKSVSVCATHAVLSEDASQLIQNSKNIEKVYTTDTIEHKDLPPKYQIVPILEYVFSGLEYI